MAITKKFTSRSARCLSGKKCLPPSKMNRDELGLTQWKERIDFRKMSSDLHTRAIAGSYPRTHARVLSCKINKNIIKILL